MPAVCFYFQVHQPFRLRRYSVFDSGSEYFDNTRNRRLLERVAEKCYIPSTQMLLDLIERHGDAVRIAFSLTGNVLDQMRKWSPQSLEQFEKLAKTGNVEFLGETYHHSLAFLYSRTEFDQQVADHADLIESLFGQRPKVFRNTELVYSNELAEYLAKHHGYKAVLSEGADHVLGQRDPNHVYQPPGDNGLKVLLKNYGLSDDIAFRFSQDAERHHSLRAEEFVRWIGRGYGGHRGAPGADHEPQICNVFMDFETIGEHQWAETGIFRFFESMFDQLVKQQLPMVTPSQAAEQFSPVDVFDVPHMISWADTERDLSAWLGNAMQSNALHELYQLESAVKKSGQEKSLADWRRLTTSDHFYYMCTKYFADGDVHKYFNPYESPYDSYINFMNVLDNLRLRVGV